MNDDALLDARLRRGLQALPAPDEARTAAALAEVTGRGRPPAREPWLVALVAAVVVGVLVLGPQLLRALVGDDEPAPAPSPRSELQGTWSRMFDGARTPSWTGVWTIGFEARGVLTVTPPTASPEGTDGAAYDVSGAQVRVDAFVNGVCNELPPGTYSWSTARDTLRLTAVDDQCAPRAELFTGTWAVVP